MVSERTTRADFDSDRYCRPITWNVEMNHSHTDPTLSLDRIHDFADRVECLQLMFKDLIAAHPIADLFGDYISRAAVSLHNLKNVSHLLDIYSTLPAAKKVTLMAEMTLLCKESRP